MRSHYKNGRQVWYSNKSWTYAIQHTVQGEHIKGNQPRLGTKDKASSHKCRCDDCTKTAKTLKYKQSKKDFRKEIAEIS